MADDRHQRVSELFLAVCELDDLARQRALDKRCADDPDLRATVERLLADDADPASFLDTPALGPGFEMRTAREPLEVPCPSDIGGYKIVRVIGEGGMGVVYLAEQPATKRRVALKVVRPGLATASARRRFDRESDLLARLRHPGIALIYEAGIAETEFGPQPFFAMEFVDGRPLIEHAEQSGLNAKQRLELMQQVCHAVHHAHQKGVIHRDLKPANILVEERGQPKILDFGVARAIDADVDASSMHTNVGQLIGTVAYMSPEQAAGDTARVDTRSDLYALGVVCYELLAGRLPYEVSDRAVHEVIRAIREDDPAPLSSVSRAFRGDLETIVAKAMDKDQDRRYHSASELAADIGRFLGRDPIIARPASVAYQLRRFAQRHRAMVAGGAMAAAAILVGLAGTTWQAVIAQRERDRAVDAEARAARRFEQVRSLANAFIFDIHDEIETVPGTTAARRTLVTTALRYLDALAADESNDHTLQQDLAEGYLKIGHVLGNPGVANLGDQPGALESYEKALAIRETLVARRPTDHEARLDVANALRVTGEILAVTGETREALSRHERAVSIARLVLTAESDHRRARSEIAANLRLMGRVVSKLGDMDRALAWERAAVEIDEGLLADARDDPAQLNALRGSSYELAEVLQTMGQTDSALASFTRSLELAQRICELGPDNPRHQRGLFLGHLRVGDLLSNTGRADDALAHFQAGLEIVQALATADPRDRRARHDISYATERIGYFHLEQGRAQQALDTFETGLEARTAVAEASPSDAEASFNLAISLMQVGEALVALGRADEALGKLELALRRAESLCEQDPDDSWGRWLLSNALDNVGNALDSLGRYEDMLATYERMREVAASMIELAPDNIDNLTMLAQALDRLGAAQAKTGHHDEAVARHEESLRMREGIVDRDPANAPAKLSVAVSHENLGRVLADTASRRREALAHYRDAINIRESISPADPDEPRPTSALALNHEHTGCLLRDLGEFDEAINSLQISVDLRQMILSTEPDSKERRHELSATLVELASAHRARADDATAPRWVRAHALRTAIGLLGRACDASEDVATQVRADLAACRETLAAFESRPGK